MDLVNASDPSHSQPVPPLPSFESPSGTETSVSSDIHDESSSESGFYGDYETASETDEPISRFSRPAYPFPPREPLFSRLETPSNTTPWRYPPTSWELEVEGLTHTLPLKADMEDQIDDTSESKEWLEPERNMGASCFTERLVVNALEYSIDQDRLTLACPEGPQARVVDPRSIQLRWL